MNKYYEDDNTTIYHGDNTNIEIDNYDLLVTDPPYGINYESNFRINKHLPIHGDDILPIERINYFIGMANCASYVFCRWDKIHLFNKPKSLISWVKLQHSAGDLEHEHGRRWEAICFYPGRNHKFTKRPTDVIEMDRTENNRHPTEKPVGVMEKIISSNEGNIVFDPYCGSGSSLLAARNCGRKSIGIEIEEKYCEIAANRCRQGVLFG